MSSVAPRDWVDLTKTSPPPEPRVVRLYANGEGVVKDSAEAMKWFRKAADQRDADAQGNLGNMFADGEGVAKDRAEAVKW